MGIKLLCQIAVEVSEYQFLASLLLLSQTSNSSQIALVHGPCFDLLPGTVHVCLCVRVCKHAGERGQDIYYFLAGCLLLFSPVPPTLSPLLVPRTLEMPLLRLEQKLGRSAWRGRYVVSAFWPHVLFCLFLQDVP